MTNRKIGGYGLVAVLVGLSGWLWWTADGVETDGAVARMAESYTCGRCGHRFEVTIAEATAMYRTGEGIVCPACHEAGAAKDHVEWTIGDVEPGPAEDSASEGDGEPDEAAPAPKPTVAGGVREKGS